MRPPSATPSLQAALDQYLAVRRALGVKLHLPGRLLQRFVDFADCADAAYITTDRGRPSLQTRSRLNGRTA